jgi:hypothetical protein
VARSLIAAISALMLPSALLKLSGRQLDFSLIGRWGLVPIALMQRSVTLHRVGSVPWLIGHTTDAPPTSTLDLIQYRDVIHRFIRCHTEALHAIADQRTSH